MGMRVAGEHLELFLQQSVRMRLDLSWRVVDVGFEAEVFQIRGELEVG